MAINLNRVLLAGNLTRDPVVRFFANERAVADFSIAVNRKFKAADGTQKDETVFVDCEAWGRDAELIGQYCTKGKPLFVEGRLKMDSWEDKETHQKRTKMKVVVERFQFADTAPRGDRAPGEEGSGAPAGGYDSQDSSAPAPASAPRRPAPAPAGDDEPPF